MPRALQISGMAVPLASSASASRSLRMICSGEWRMRFMVSPSDLKGENDSHTRWTSPAGAGQMDEEMNGSPQHNRPWPERLAPSPKSVISRHVSRGGPEGGGDEAVHLAESCQVRHAR